MKVEGEENGSRGEVARDIRDSRKENLFNPKIEKKKKTKLDIWRWLCMFQGRAYALEMVREFLMVWLVINYKIK